MAERDLQIKISVLDKFSSGLKELEKGLGRVDSESKELQNSTKLLEKMALGGGVAFGVLAGAIGVSVNESIKKEQADVRLTQLLRTATKAGYEQIEGLKQQAKALEAVGVVSADNIVIAQGQLATFDLSTEAIGKLIPSVLNYAVAEKGAAVSADELKQMTNGLAQALNGNFTSLTKTGFVLDETTKHLISNGTESERTAALVKVLDSTYKGMNERMKDTTMGGIIGMKNAFDNLKQAIGDAFVGDINKVTKSLEGLTVKLTSMAQGNQELVQSLGTIGLGVSGAVAGLGVLGLTLKTLSIGFAQLGLAMKSFLLGPWSLFIVAASAIATVVSGQLNRPFNELTRSLEAQSQKMNDLTDTFVALRNPIVADSEAIKQFSADVSSAAKAVEGVRKEIAKTISDSNQRQKDLDMDLGEAIVEQQQKVADIENEIDQKKVDLKKERRNSDNRERTSSLQLELQELQEKLVREQTALRSHAELEKTLSVEVAEAKRFSNLTEFEQKVELINKEKLEEKKRLAERVANLNIQLAEEKRVLGEATKAQAAYYKDIENKEKKRLEQFQVISAEIQKEMIKTAALAAELEGTKSNNIFKQATNFLKKISGNLKNLPGISNQITPFADGGIVTSPTLGLVGEAGPEAIIPLSKAGSMGGTTVNIVVHGDISGRDLVEKVKDALIGDLQREQRV